MSYIVLARKWRPMVFEDVIGQEHITQILMNALKNQRIAHAFIFAGPRGVGKTSTARLLAKALNCERQPAVNPCNECATCISITEGHSLDVIEIDGASNRGIDEIRNLRENIRFTPASCRFKIYIIDEVHMLTKEAFNALLKTLEEPPAHAIFIFATTEIHKVPLTILSRCQRFDFKRLSVSRIQQMLKKIVQSENVEIEDEALLLIAKKADGSMRDAESILDQMISLSSGKLTVELIRDSLGLISQELYFDFTDLLQEKDTAKIMQYANNIFSSGYDLIDYLHGLQEHFRDLLIANSLNDTSLLDVAEYLKKRYQEQASRFVDLDLIHYLNILGESEQILKYSYLPELAFEMMLLKIAYKPSSINLEEILGFIEKSKQSSAPGGRESNPSGSFLKSRNSIAKPDLKGSSESDLGPDTSETVTETAASQSKTEFSSLGNTLQQFKKLNKNEPTKSMSQHSEFNVALSEIQEKWAEIVDHVRTQKIALGSFLQEGIPYQTDKGRLIIAYDHHTDFHKEHVEKNSKIIEGILKNDFNLPIRIGFKSIDFKAEGIKQVPRTPEEILEDIKNKEPIIRKIIDVFDLDQNISKNIG